jgi:hypothetical protein
VDDPQQPSEPVTKLLAGWGIPTGAAVALTAYGTNNHTLRVAAGDRRWSLRISQNLTSAQVQAEHRLLPSGWLPGIDAGPCGSART